MSADDKAEVKRVIIQYAEAYLQGDVDALRNVFAPDAMMYGHVGERLVVGPPDVFIQNVRKNPSIASLGGNSIYEIGAVEIEGNAAAVTIKEHGFGEMNFIDFMHLLKRDGTWKIVSKTFSTF